MSILNRHDCSITFLYALLLIIDIRNWSTSLSKKTNKQLKALSDIVNLCTNFEFFLYSDVSSFYSNLAPWSYDGNSNKSWNTFGHLTRLPFNIGSKFNLVFQPSVFWSPVLQNMHFDLMKKWEKQPKMWNWISWNSIFRLGVF